MSAAARAVSGIVHGYHHGRDTTVCGKYQVGVQVQAVDGLFPMEGERCCERCMRHYLKCSSCILENPYAHPKIDH